MTTDRRLSERLEAVVAALSPCQLLADVGTDHGLVPIAAVVRGIAARAIAADLRAAPLAGAQRTIERAGVEGRVTTLRSDGLRELVGLGADALVMAGMSGTLMAQLCENTPDALYTVRRFVAQANTGMADIRGWGYATGWQLVDERIVEEGGRFFTVCVFEPGVSPDRDPYAVPGWSAEQLLRVGPLLLTRASHPTRRWYEAQVARLRTLVKGGASNRAAELAMWSAALAMQGAAGPP